MQEKKEVEDKLKKEVEECMKQASAGYLPLRAADISASLLRLRSDCQAIATNASHLTINFGTTTYTFIP